MDKLLLSRQQSRMVDEYAINALGITGLVLMENAGRGVVDVLLANDPGLVADDKQTVLILCGKGNNAGDGFVIARHLAICDVAARIVLLSPAESLRGDALANFEILTNLGISITDLSAERDLASALSERFTDAAWIVDAMLGTGAVGEPREPFATAIAWANSQEVRRLAVDVPSGLDCDTGAVSENTFQADVTCTFVAAKQGFIRDRASQVLGQLRVVSIGIPVESVLQMIQT